MYVIRDKVASEIKSHVDSMRFKNTVLRHWPKRTMPDGTVVFDRMYLWTEGGGVIDTPGRRKLYNLMGINIEDIESQDKKGLTSLYLDVSDLSKEVVVTDDDIKSYIEKFTPRIYPDSKDVFNSDAEADTDLNPDPYKDGDVLDGDGDVLAPLWDKDGWITSYLTYKPMSGKLIDPNISDVDILAKCSGYNPEEILFPDSTFNRLTGTAILDVNGVLFERSMRIIQRTVEERHMFVKAKNSSSNVSRYLVGAKIEFKFRRIANASDASVSGLIDDIKERIDDLNFLVSKKNVFDLLKNSSKLSQNLSINRQLVRMANYSNGYVDNSNNYLISDSDGGDYIDTDPVVGLKYDYLSNLKPREFAKVFGTKIVSGYDEKKAEWWEVVIVAVIVIITVVIAVILAIPTGGGSIGWASAAITLAVGSLILTGLAMYWANNGQPGAARIAAGGAEILGYLSMATGIAAAISNLATYSAKEAALATAKAELAKAGANATSAQVTAVAAAQAALPSTLSLVGSAINIINTIGTQAGLIDDDLSTILNIVSVTAMSFDTFTSAINIQEIAPLADLNRLDLTGVTKFTQVPTSTIMQSTIKLTNTYMNGYIQLIQKDTANEFSDKQAVLEAQEKELDTLNPEHTDATWVSYTDPYGSIFELGDMYERSYVMLTSGKNRLLMNKCYESGY